MFTVSIHFITAKKVHLFRLLSPTTTKGSGAPLTILYTVNNLAKYVRILDMYGAKDSANTRNNPLLDHANVSCDFHQSLLLWKTFQILLYSVK